MAGDFARDRVIFSRQWPQPTRGSFIYRGTLLIGGHQWAIPGPYELDRVNVVAILRWSSTQNSDFFREKS